ncbi:hypothetical protein [Nesterenkonia flava]|uniref:Uncharacterized protein n=1 Tax=Nesterenkonia flava TaxID=469799 RepID=A0ABU1FW95_9MICC|nr:hypothetical protein [Nesterenkonia flava]MDR5712955.1 hypothetical protein [Nesterenkonia flava]
MATDQPIAGRALCRSCGVFEDVPEDLAEHYTRLLRVTGELVPDDLFRDLVDRHRAVCPNPGEWHPDYPWQTMHVCHGCRPRMTGMFECCGDTFKLMVPATESERVAAHELVETLQDLHKQTCQKSRTRAVVR